MRRDVVGCASEPGRTLKLARPLGAGTEVEALGSHSMQSRHTAPVIVPLRPVDRQSWSRRCGTFVAAAAGGRAVGSSTGALYSLAMPNPTLRLELRSDIAQHSFTVEIELELYGHVTPRMRSNAAARFGSLLSTARSATVISLTAES